MSSALRNVLLAAVLIGVGLLPAREARAIEGPIAIGVGTMSDRTRGVHLGGRLREAILAELRAARQVVILPDRPSPALSRSLQRRRLARYFLEGAVSEVRTERVGRGLRVRCAISLMVLADPSRDLRMVLSSAATAEQTRAGRGSEIGLQGRALEGAVRGVFGRLLRTLTARAHGFGGLAS